MFRVVAVVLAASLSFGLAACRRSPGVEQVWSAEQVRNELVRVTPKEVKVSRDRLYVKVTLFNTTDKDIMVDRDAIVLRVGSGAEVRRSVGVTSMHKPHTIAPGGYHAVHVDFRATDFDWSTVETAEVDFSQAVFAGSEPVAVPTFVVKSRTVPER